VEVTSSPKIQVFTNDGIFITQWGSLGNADGQFNSAVGVAVDPNGDVLVAEENHRVQRFACSPPPAVRDPRRNKPGDSGGERSSADGHGDYSKNR
jgi:hypothetical protein